MLRGTSNMRSEQIVAVRWPVRAWVSFCFRDLYLCFHRQVLLELYSKKLFFPVGFWGGWLGRAKRLPTSKSLNCFSINKYIFSILNFIRNFFPYQIHKSYFHHIKTYFSIMYFAIVAHFYFSYINSTIA